MSPPHILIAGAGIGGLTAALALARRGVDVTIVEKRTGFGELGAGLQITPNSGRVLEALGLKLPLMRVSVGSQGLTVRRWRSGATLARSHFDPKAAETPFRMLKRSDLHTVLLDAARSMPNIRLVVGRGLAEARQDEDGITVTLEGRAGTQGEDLRGCGLVGADGLWSRVRELTGDRAPPPFTGFEAWRALAPGPARTEPTGVTLHLGAGHHAVHYAVAGGRETNLVVVRRAAEAREGWSRDGEASEMLAETRDASAPLRNLVASASGWLAWSLFDRPPAAMAKGRIALLGDAAHPVLPFLAQGASLAIEDAAVLARVLAERLASDGAAGVPAAMTAYAAARTDRVRHVQQASRANGRTYHLGWPLSVGRDLVLGRIGGEGLQKRYDWVYDWRDA